MKGDQLQEAAHLATYYHHCHTPKHCICLLSLLSLGLYEEISSDSESELFIDSRTERQTDGSSALGSLLTTQPSQLHHLKA